MSTAASSNAAAVPSIIAPPARNIAIDAFRGLMLFLMMAEVLKLTEVSAEHPGNPFWRALAYHNSHVEWAGMSLHDVIQPAFTFIAGVSLAYSIRSRQSRGEPFSHSLRHAITRSVLLISIGIAINLYFGFTLLDTLTQIGMGYTFAFLLGHLRERWQWLAFTLILLASFAAFALYPLPPAGFDYGSVGVPGAWQRHLLHGFAAHWNINTNAGAAFDRWLYRAMPHRRPFAYGLGGYSVINWIPTLATLLLGVIAGGWLLAQHAPPLRRLTMAGAMLSVAGWSLHASGLCPIVKRLWTPSFVLASGGVSLLTLAAFCALAHFYPARRAAFPLIVLGMNSLAAYLLSFAWDWIVLHLVFAATRHLTDANPRSLELLLVGVASLFIEWGLLLVLYRQGVFLRV